MIHFWNITRDQIRELRAEAAAFDDGAMVAICDHALGDAVAAPSFVDCDGQLWRTDGEYCAIVAYNREASRRLIATGPIFVGAYRPGDEEWIDPLYTNEDIEDLDDVIAAIRVAYATPVTKE